MGSRQCKDVKDQSRDVFHMFFFLSLDLDNAVYPAMTCALSLISYRAVNSLVMRGIVHVSEG